jgi:hypothetical protein
LIRGHASRGRPGFRLCRGNGAVQLLRCFGQLGVVKAAEEKGRVRQVLKRLGAAVEVGLQVLKADPVGGHRVLREVEHVLAHEVEELTGVLEVSTLGLDNAVFVALVIILCDRLCDRLCGRGSGVGGHG